MQTSNIKIPHLPSGIEDFAEMRLQRITTDNSHFAIADKTMFLPQLLSPEDAVAVFTRPIRFMKSSTLSMIESFASIKNAEENKPLFDGLAISNEKYAKFRSRYQGQFPVIHLTFKNVEASTWAEAKSSLSKLIALLYNKHQDILPSLTKYEQEHYLRIMHNKSEDGDLENSLADLATYLFEHYNKKAIILIDEYDTPLHYANKHTKVEQRDDEDCYFKLMAAFMRRFLGIALKSHPHVEKGIMTGVLRTAFASLVSSLNNTTAYSVLSYDFVELFGFTETEVHSFVDQIEGMSKKEKEKIKGRLQSWYSGYYIGNSSVNMYNPWSVAQFFKRLKTDHERQTKDDHWLQTDNSLAILPYLKPRFNRIYADLAKLMTNNDVKVDVNERTSFPDLDNAYNDSAFWGLLLQAGYLSTSNIKVNDENTLKCNITIPNYEIKGAYAHLIKRYQESFDPGGDNRNAMIESLMTGNMTEFSINLQKFMEQAFNYYDAPKNDSTKVREQAYHSFLFALLAGLNSSYFHLSSNREAGHGRYDIALMPKDKTKHGLILEIKSTDNQDNLISESENALQQIEEKRYGAALEANDIASGIYIGLSFYGKHFHISHKKVSYKLSELV